LRHAKILSVFLLTGFWHGASWNFIFWGFWNGLFIILEKAFGLEKDTKNRKIKFFRHLYVIFVFVIGWVMFRSDNMTYALTYLKNMFGLVKVHDIAYSIPYYLGNIEIITLIAAIICSIPIFSGVNKYLKYDGTRRIKVLNILNNTYLTVLFLLSTIFIAASTYNPFIYFRF